MDRAHHLGARKEQDYSCLTTFYWPSNRVKHFRNSILLKQDWPNQTFIGSWFVQINKLKSLKGTSSKYIMFLYPKHTTFKKPDLYLLSRQIRIWFLPFCFVYVTLHEVKWWLVQGIIRRARCNARHSTTLCLQQQNIVNNHSRLAAVHRINTNEMSAFKRDYIDNLHHKHVLGLVEIKWQHLYVGT